MPTDQSVLLFNIYCMTSLDSEILINYKLIIVVITRCLVAFYSVLVVNSRLCCFLSEIDTYNVECCMVLIVEGRVFLKLESETITLIMITLLGCTVWNSKQ